MFEINSKQHCDITYITLLILNINYLKYIDAKILLVTTNEVSKVSLSISVVVKL